jgi:xylulokinase
MAGLGLEVGQVRATGGGARGPLWRQIQADVFGLPVHQTAVDEGPAYGAALIAGVAAGLFRDVEQASSVIRLRPEVAEPDPARSRLYERYYDTYRSLYPATAAAMRQLSELALAGSGSRESLPGLLT